MRGDEIRARAHRKINLQNRRARKRIHTEDIKWKETIGIWPLYE